MSRRSTSPSPSRTDITSAAEQRPGRRRTAIGSLLCATCLVAGVGFTAAPARAAASARTTAHHAADGGSGTERATSMLPAASPDGAAARAAARLSPAVSPHALQSVAAGDLSGIDVADYQHPNGAAINWAAVRASGVTFAYVKSSEGNYYKNRYYVQDVTAARAAGVSVGAYHFAEPNTPAIAQADYFAAAARAAGTDLPPVLDLEETDGLSVAALQTWTATFLARVRADLGATPVIYTGPYFWADDMGNSAAFTGYPLWVANYSPSAAPDSVGAWRAWTFWQWSDGSYPAVATVPGISGYVDRDRFAGSAAPLAQLAAGVAGQWMTTAGASIFGRSLSATEWGTYTNELLHGTSRLAMAYRLENTSLGLEQDVLRDYEQILRRGATSAEVIPWVIARERGFTKAHELVDFVSSAEFYDHEGGGTLSGWVQALYQNVLGRPASPAEVSGQLAYLARGTTTAQLAYAFVDSPEGLAHDTNGAYELVLHRGADPAGLRSGPTTLNNTTSWPTLLAELYASNEYQSRIVG